MRWRSAWCRASRPGRGAWEWRPYRPPPLRPAVRRVPPAATDSPDDPPRVLADQRRDVARRIPELAGASALVLRRVGVVDPGEGGARVVPVPPVGRDPVADRHDRLRPA